MDKLLHDKFTAIKEIADQQEQLTSLEILLIDFCEPLLEINTALEKQTQQLRNKVSELTGEKGQPNVRKQAQEGDHSSENERNSKNKKKRGKNKKNKKEVKISKVIKLTVKPAGIPSDAKPKGFKSTVIQDIIITTNNTRYLRQQFYSPSQDKYYLSPLPEGCDGKYGPNIKSWAAVLYADKELTLNNITKLFTTAGVQVSKSTISNFIIQQGTAFKPEKIDIAKAAINSTIHCHLDDTSARENGQNRIVNVLGNQYASIFFTLSSKSRLSIIEMLSMGNMQFVINSLTGEILAKMNVSQKDINAVLHHKATKPYTLEAIKKIIDDALKGKKKPNIRKRILEACAISSYRNQPHAIQQLIVDDAPQFKLITELLALCWVHEGRHYKKLYPIFKKNKKLLEELRGQLWDYYDQLLAYKIQPNEIQAKQLRQEFITLFSQKTGYEKLDKQLTLTLNKIDSLLLVLDHPNTPLHNNPAELIARKQARARDIHLHTMSKEGTEAKDALLTITETCNKLSVNVFDYFHDKITKSFTMKSLSELIQECSIDLDTG